jgi:hypothetical protein
MYSRFVCLILRCELTVKQMKLIVDLQQFERATRAEAHLFGFPVVDVLCGMIA